MAQFLRLYNSSVLVDLHDSSVLGLREALGALGNPQIDRQWSPVWGRGHHPLAGVSYGNREVPLVAVMKGTSLDNWIQNSQNAHHILRETERFYASGGRDGDPACLQVQLDGMTYAVELDVMAGELDDSHVLQVTMTRTTAPVLAEAPLTLWCKPWFRPQSLTRVTSSSITNGSATQFTLPAPLGELPMPAKVTVQSAAGDTFQRIIAGRKSRGNVANIIHVMECETGTYTGYTVTSPDGLGSNQAVAAASNGNVRRVTGGALGSTMSLAWEITSELADWMGTYRVFLRVDTGDTDWTYARLSYGGATGEDVPNTSVTPSSPGNTDRLVDLGKIVIPHRIGPLSPTMTSYIFALDLVLTGGANTLDLDCIYLVPCDEYYVDVQTSAVLSAQDQIVLDGLLPAPAGYILDSTGLLQPERVIPNGVYSQFVLEPRKENRFFVIALRSSSIGASGAHDLTDVFTVTVDYWPLYNRFRVA